MSKKLLFSNIQSEQEYKASLRHFSASALLRNLCGLSKELLINGCSVEQLTTKVMTTDPKTGIQSQLDVIVQPWQFPDLAYHVIKYSNDYRAVDKISKDIILLLLRQNDDFLSLKQQTMIPDIKNRFEGNLFLSGFAGEQFRYQSRGMFYHRLIRELYIIFSLSKKTKSLVDPEAIIKKETGLEWKDLVFSLYGIFVDSCFPDIIHPSVDRLVFETCVDKQLVFEKLMNYYSADYEEIRKSALGRQIFYVKPFVKTQNSGILSVSVFLNQFIVEHAPFWVLRNYYQKQPDNHHKQDFTNEFGDWFELYFDEVASKFKIVHQRIQKQNNKKRADWKLVLGNYTFLVEQKSAIVQLSVKQQLTDFQSYKSAIKKTIFKALEQLEETERDLDIKKPIKIILCYDDYIDPNLLPSVFSETDCPVKDDNRYFILNTIEIEMLLSLASSNPNLFEKTIEDLLNRRSSVDREKSIMLLKVMEDNGYSQNPYWTLPIFKPYKDLLIGIRKKHERFLKNDQNG